LKLRAASIAAAAAAGAQGGAAASTGRQAPGYGSKQVNVTGNSDPVAVASVLNKVLCQHGWAELVCLGRQDEGLANAMQVIG
jgi:hypothetical protein